MRADYHFHPNLHAKRQEKRLRDIWQALDDNTIDALVCTEHAYKNPAEAYQRMMHTRPANASTHVYPGAELISREGKGIEIVAFAEEPWYDDHPDILQPLTMRFEDMIAYLKETDLTWFVPHPFLLGNPLKKLYRNTDDVLQFLREVPAFEVENGCYLLLEQLYRYLPGSWLIKKQADKLKRSVQLPSTHIPEGNHSFLAVGSDAHHPRDIGFAVDFESDVDGADRSAVFAALTSNRSVNNVRIPAGSFSLRHLLYTAWTTFSEASMKREWRRYAYQHTTFALTRSTTTRPSVQ